LDDSPQEAITPFDRLIIHPTENFDITPEKSNFLSIGRENVIMVPN
jgi:hypothetical protein